MKYGLDIPENANGQVRSILADLRDNLLKQLLHQKNENFEIEEIFGLLGEFSGELTCEVFFDFVSLDSTR